MIIYKRKVNLLFTGIKWKKEQKTKTKEKLCRPVVML